jgi:hypothetical protein
MNLRCWPSIAQRSTLRTLRSQRSIFAEWLLSAWAPINAHQGQKCSHTDMRHAAPSQPSAQLLYHPQVICHRPLIVTNNLKHSVITLMSHLTGASSSKSGGSNFQLINNALKVYRKRTKNDLLLHPLAAQIQTCHSPSDILAVLQQQVQGLDQSRSGDDRWTKWLDPTINVLLTFSQTAGTVGLVCPKTCAYSRSGH